MSIPAGYQLPQFSQFGQLQLQLNAILADIFGRTNAYVKLPSYTVANLPSASTSGAGAMVLVTDATLTAITGLGLAPTGGGSNKVPAYSNGTSWALL